MYSLKVIPAQQQKHNPENLCTTCATIIKPTERSTSLLWFNLVKYFNALLALCALRIAQLSYIIQIFRTFLPDFKVCRENRVAVEHGVRPQNTASLNSINLCKLRHFEIRLSRLCRKFIAKIKPLNGCSKATHWNKYDEVHHSLSILSEIKSFTERIQSLVTCCERLNCFLLLDLLYSNDKLYFFFFVCLDSRVEKFRLIN